MKKQCYFKSNKIENIDFRDVSILSKFVTPSGRIMSRKRTGVSAGSQRDLSKAIKNARFMALMPYINR